LEKKVSSQNQTLILVAKRKAGESIVLEFLDFSCAANDMPGSIKVSFMESEPVTKAQWSIAEIQRGLLSTNHGHAGSMARA